MFYLVIIGTTAGTQAVKKYECDSLADALEAAEIDLWDYPNCRVRAVQAIYETSEPQGTHHDVAF